MWIEEIKCKIKCMCCGSEMLDECVRSGSEIVDKSMGDESVMLNEHECCGSLPSLHIWRCIQS